MASLKGESYTVLQPFTVETHRPNSSKVFFIVKELPVGTICRKSATFGAGDNKYKCNVDGTDYDFIEITQDDLDNGYIKETPTPAGGRRKRRTNKKRTKRRRKGKKTKRRFMRNP
jgi:hypothetical protein